MLTRVCGREQEYGMVIKPTKIFPKINPFMAQGIVRDDFCVWRKRFAAAIINKIAEDFPAFSNPEQVKEIWIGNGSRIYIDLLCVLEFATAEYRSCSLEGILQEKASELILNKVLKKAAAEEEVNLISLYKNNAAPSGFGDAYDEFSYASHHNYSYESKKQTAVFSLLESFIPASLILSGNGHVLRRGGNFFYVLSQRAPHINLRKSTFTLNDRAIINLRDESLMDKASGLSRLHLISRDATRCEFQTWLVDGITHLVIRLAEEGWKLPKRLILDRPLLNFHRLNLSRGLQYQLQTVSKKVDAVDYLFLFLTAAQQLNPLSSEEKKILQEWERVLELLQAKAYDKLVGELDWVTKWYLLKNQMQREGYGLDDIRAWLLDMKYHNISPDPNQSVFAWLDEKGYIKHLVTEKAIQAAVYTPPETRAKSRGRLVSLAAKQLKLFYRINRLNWESVEFRNYKSAIYFGAKDNPLVTESAELENFYKELGLDLD